MGKHGGVFVACCPTLVVVVALQEAALGMHARLFHQVARYFPSGFSAETREMHGLSERSGRGNHPFRRGGDRFAVQVLAAAALIFGLSMIPEACTAALKT